MVFSSTLFLFVFFVVTLLGYFILRGKLRNYWLFIVSLIFFGWAQPGYLWIIILNIVINYICALLIDKFRKIQKPLLFAGISVNLLILFYFKYFDFALQSINKIANCSFELKNIILPIGISFFTFQGMSYVIDVYRKDVPVQKNIFKVGLYIVLFPQLIAGPIVRYKDIAVEIDERKIQLDDFVSGIERFIIGLGKKTIIANTMALTVDSIWNNGADANSWAIAWAGSIAYTLQIYFDFSGYSDMAIGLGRMFGFHFNENFNLPYISESISEFWRRWHISLSSWFRDYVYIPLGGNRKHVYLNLALVFLLTGIWHGASWHYIAWGVWNGFFVLLERVIRNEWKKRHGDSLSDSGAVPDANKITIKRILLKIYTLLMVNFGWVLFRAPHTKDALQYVGTMLGIIVPKEVGFTVFWYLDKWTLTIMIIGILFSTSLPKRLGEWMKNKIPFRVFTVMKYVSLLVLFYFSVLRIVAGTYNPFIYFQF